jgi:hypothetical protein
MIKKKFITFSILIIIGILVFVVIKDNQNTIGVEETIEKEQLRKELKALFKDKYTIPILNIYNVKEIEHLINSSKKKETLSHSNISKEDSILRFSFKDKRYVKLNIKEDAPKIVTKAAIETLINISISEIDSKIKFIELYYEPKVFLQLITANATILISVEEFNKTYSNLKNKGLTEEEILEELYYHYKSKANFGG